jgi:hypothetical protein
LSSGVALAERSTSAGVSLRLEKSSLVGLLPLLGASDGSSLMSRATYSATAWRAFDQRPPFALDGSEAVIPLPANSSRKSVGRRAPMVAAQRSRGASANRAYDRRTPMAPRVNGSSSKRTSATHTDTLSRRRCHANDSAVSIQLLRRKRRCSCRHQIRLQSSKMQCGSMSVSP